MSIEYEITLDDLVALTLYHSETAPGMRRNRVLLLGMGGVLLLFAVATTFSTDWKAALSSPMGFLLTILPIVLPIGLLYYTLSPGMRSRQAKFMVARTYKDGKGHNVFGKHTLTVSPEGLVETIGATEYRTAWASVERIGVTPEYVFIYTSPIQASVVPRRAFADEAASQEFIRTIQEYQSNPPPGASASPPPAAA